MHMLCVLWSAMYTRVVSVVCRVCVCVFNVACRGRCVCVVCVACVVCSVCVRNMGRVWCLWYL